MDKQLQSIIDEHQNIVVLAHLKPDGDAIGSKLALAKFLKDMGKNVFVVSNDIVPYNINFLVDDIMDIKIYTEEEYDELSIKSSLVFCMDSSDIDRLDTRAKYLKEAVSVCIDHHITNNGFADYNYVRPDISSTGEVLYDLLYDNDEYKITKEIASAIYVAILTDTGGFRYSNTTARTLDIVSNLFKVGIEYSDINIEIFQKTPVEKFVFTNMILNTLELYHDGKIGFIYITEDMLNKKNMQMQDSDGIVERIRDIENVELALFVREITHNVFKLSVRSKKYYNAARLCLKFDGGGHERAAGAKILGELDEVRRKLLSSIDYNGEKLI